MEIGLAFPDKARVTALEAENKELREAVWAYLSEFDNPVPDTLYRKTLRDRLRTLVGAPPQRLRKSG